MLLYVTIRLETQLARALEDVAKYTEGPADLVTLMCMKAGVDKTGTLYKVLSRVVHDLWG